MLANSKIILAPFSKKKKKSMFSLDKEEIFSFLNTITKHLSLTPSFYALSAYTLSDDSTTEWGLEAFF